MESTTSKTEATKVVGLSCSPRKRMNTSHVRHTEHCLADLANGL